MNTMNDEEMSRKRREEEERSSKLPKDSPDKGMGGDSEKEVEDY